MRIPRSFIDELITRIDIVDLIDSYVSLRKAGRNYTACCPFHNEKTPSFTVSLEKQFYYCFGCGAHGTAIGFLINYAQLNFIEAVHELASRVGIEVVYEQGGSPPASIAAFDDLYQIMAQAAQYYRQQLRQSQTAINYLKKRGLTGEIARDFGIGYAPPGWDNLLKSLGTNPEMRASLLKTGLIKQNEAGHRYDSFRDRIMFPINDQRGRVIAFGGRSLNQNEHEAKYLNSPETPLFQKSKALYGWYLARKVRPLTRIIVVEGYMDVVALAQAGITNAVATLGTATTSEHFTHLFRSVPEIIFSFDGDNAGQRAAWRALETALPLLPAGHQISFAFLPQGHDPDSLVRLEGAQAFNARLTQAMPLSDFLFNNLKQQVNLNTPEGRANLVEKAKPLLERLPTGSYRNQMWLKLSQLSGETIHKDKIHKQPIVRKIKKPGTSFIELSSVHQAIVYLLYKPGLSQSIENYNKLLLLHHPDIKLLLNIIELTRKNPQLNLGAICEHWRGTEYDQTINWLATRKVEFFTKESSINIDKEFLEAINRLHKDYAEQRQKFLEQKKMNVTKLTAEEKQELQSLYKYCG